jgi:NAD-dependent deacetylase
VQALSRVVVLTGAGISAESGLQTFRGANGLWEGHRVEDVATPEAWAANPGLVLEFYNQRRRAVRQAKPNAAHRAVVDLERAYDVRIVTQNVDDLHERAGSTQVLHLHGEIMPAMDEAVELVAGADILLVVGTSLQVYPAAGLVFEAPRKARRIVVNPEVPERIAGPGFEVVAKPATVGVPEVVAGLLEGRAGAPPGPRG